METNKNETKIKTLEEFWPFYLSQHRGTRNRDMHFVGTSLVIIFFFAALVFQNYWYLVMMPLVGYFFAWVGHFIFAKNRPATFQYPFYSLYSDFKMYFYWIAGKLPAEFDKFKINPELT